MKFKLINYITLLICLPFFASSQQLDYGAGTIEWDGEMRPAITVNVEVPSKLAKQTWKKFLEKEHNLNVNGFGFMTNRDVLTVEKAQVEAISSKQMDLLADFEETEKGTQISIFASLGYDLYISADKFPKEYTALEKLSLQYLDRLVPNYLADAVEALEDQLTDLEKGLKKDRKDLRKNKNAIEKMQDEITDLREQNQSLVKAVDQSTQQVVETENQLQRKQNQVEAVRNQLESAQSEL